MRKLFLISVIFSTLFFISSCKEKNYSEQEYRISYVYDYNKKPPKIILYLYPRVIQTDEKSCGGYYVLTKDEILKEMEKMGHVPADTNYFSFYKKRKYLHGIYIVIDTSVVDNTSKFETYKEYRFTNYLKNNSNLDRYYLAIKK